MTDKKSIHSRSLHQIVEKPTRPLLRSRVSITIIVDRYRSIHSFTTDQIATMIVMEASVLVEALLASQLFDAVNEQRFLCTINYDCNGNFVVFSTICAL